MVPTRKLLTLAALGLVPAVLAAFVPSLFGVALAWLAGCCALMAGNFLLGVRPGDIVILRRLPQRLSLGEREAVELVVRNYSRFTVRFTLQDSPPAGWEVEGFPLGAVLKPGQEQVLTYHVTPGARGRFLFGDLYARLEHFPGLAARQVRVPAAEEARVFPDLRDVSRYELMARRSRLEDLGIHRSRLAGRGTEFERIRDYSPDDEY